MRMKRRDIEGFNRERAMLWSASVLKGYEIAGSDGLLGVVSDLLFDDANWKLRWLVVKTGHWLSGRDVLLPVVVLGHPDMTLRHFPVTLTKQQIKHSPDIETDLPVSRQTEKGLFDFYGWDPYWASGYFGGGAIATPFVAPLYHSGAIPRDPGTVDPLERDGDPHLRAASAVLGYRVFASDGAIGRVRDLLFEDTNWSVCYVEIEPESQGLPRLIYVSTHSIKAVSLKNRSLDLRSTRHQIASDTPFGPACAEEGTKKRI